MSPENKFLDLWQSIVAIVDNSAQVMQSVIIHNREYAPNHGISLLLP
jgi:hypothetical protein